MIIKDLDKKIKSAILENNWTQASLSERLGISKRSLNNILESNEVVKLDVFVRLCSALNIPPTHFLSSSFQTLLNGELAFERNRTIIEIEYEDLNKEKVKKTFAVPYSSREHFTSLGINYEIESEILRFIDIRFPRKNSETKLFQTSKDFSSNSDASIIDVINHGDLLICSKLNDKNEIQDGTIYVTLNSHIGRDLSILRPIPNEDKINFITTEYIEKGVKEEKVNYSLSLDEIYEVWKIEALVLDPSVNSLSDLDCEELKIF